MNTSEEWKARIKVFEGCRLTAYQDVGGVWSVGFGSTLDVAPGMRIHPAEAEARFEVDIRHAEKCIDASVNVPLSQGEHDSLTSFIFNLGCAKFRSSTLLKKLNDSDFDGAAAEFPRWNHVGGEVVAGLTARRKAEAERFEETT